MPFVKKCKSDEWKRAMPRVHDAFMRAAAAFDDYVDPFRQGKAPDQAEHSRLQFRFVAVYEEALAAFNRWMDLPLPFPGSGDGDWAIMFNAGHRSMLAALGDSYNCLVVARFSDNQELRAIALSSMGEGLSWIKGMQPGVPQTLRGYVPRGMKNIEITRWFGEETKRFDERCAVMGAESARLLRRQAS